MLYVPLSDGITEAGNMWSVGQFKEWLVSHGLGSSCWEEKIQPAMKHIAAATLKCAQVRASGCRGGSERVNTRH